VIEGEKREYLILKIAHGEMTLSGPTDKAEEVGMRPPISAEDVDDLFQLLSKKDVREPTNWSRRFKNHQEKLKSGDVYQVAEVVRNLALREAARGLSAGEKSMLERARVILASELSIAWDTPEEEALERLAKALV
jgi:CarD family transcriptional regulator